MSETIGALVRRLRKTEGWSQAQAATRLCALTGTASVTKSEWSRWERGRRRPVAYIDDLAELFGVDPAVLRATMAASAEPPDGSDAVADLRGTAQMLITLDGRYGGNDSHPLALRAYRTAQRDLGTFVRDPSNDLLAAIGELGEIAAWSGHDAGRHDDSRALTLEAAHLSRLAGDRSIEIFDLTHLALLDLHGHRPGSALAIVRAAEAERLPPRVRALFDLRAARAYAQTGEGARARQTLAKARATLYDGIGPEDPPWTWWIDDGELAWHHGMLCLELGEDAEAIEYLRRAADLRYGRGVYSEPGRRTGRAVYNDLAHLLNAQTRTGAYREAEETAEELLPMAGEVGSGRTEQLLRRVALRIMRDREATATLADLAEQITERLYADRD